jgi:hypothetical protein
MALDTEPDYPYELANDSEIEPQFLHTTISEMLAISEQSRPQFGLEAYDNEAEEINTLEFELIEELSRTNTEESDFYE